jgi:hypothetical protein
MKTKDLNKFKTNNRFYKTLKLVITIKSFDLQAIRKRYLKSKLSRTGSTTRRKSSLGGIAEITIKNGQIKKCKLLAKLPEPRGIDNIKNTIVFSSENKVYLLCKNKLKIISNPWFSYIHTVDINKTLKDRFVVSSSGFDCFFEYLMSGKQIFEWFAWENGFDKGLDNKKIIHLTRNKRLANKYKAKKRNYIYISDPKYQKIPTAKRAAFINSVVYDDNNKFLATLFHDGSVYQIDKSRTKNKILSNLKNPHGGLKANDFYMATSTADGEIVTNNFNIKYTFKNIPGKPSYLKNFEWIQNTKFINGYYISIDSNRNAIFVIDPSNKLISKIPFNINWAIQDLSESFLTKKQKSIIQKLNVPTY